MSGRERDSMFLATRMTSKHKQHNATPYATMIEPKYFIKKVRFPTQRQSDKVGHRPGMSSTVRPGPLDYRLIPPLAPPPYRPDESRDSAPANDGDEHHDQHRRDGDAHGPK